MMKYTFYLFLFVLLQVDAFSQQVNEFIFPSTPGWNVLKENQELSFRLRTTIKDSMDFSLDGIDQFGVGFDTLGNFKWKPKFNLVDRIEQVKDVTLIFQAISDKGERIRQPVTFTVYHVNQAPVVEDLPTIYVKQSSLNNYQIPGEYVYDPDGDPLVFKIIPSQMPEGANLSSLGLFTWTPSRIQFNSLLNSALLLEFIVQDQPDKLETKGKLRIQQTQQDLPPEILIVPSDTILRIKEDETINLKLYVSDPNGDSNIKNVGFVSTDPRLTPAALKENTLLQQEFTWTPGYAFTDEAKHASEVQLTFYALDKSNNRAQRKIKLVVNDAENLVEKDAHQYQKYRTNLVSAMLLLNQLDENQKELNRDYKRAKKGKKQRSILNASLGAATGLSPLTLDPNPAKVVSGIGGTTVLTLGTLEATEVIGKSKEDIQDKIKINIDIKNKVQAASDEFARKYSVKSARRNIEFEKDIDRLRTVMNDQKLILLELDAHIRNTNAQKISEKEIKKIFLDFSEE